MTIRAGVQDFAQIRQYRDEEIDRGCARGLLANPMQDFATDVLPSHGDNVLPSLAGVEPKRERKTWLAADRMMRLKLRNLLRGSRHRVPSLFHER